MRSFLIVAVCFLLSPIALDAQELNPKFYGFSSLSIPTEKGQGYAFRWARLGIKADNYPIQFVFEYDLSQSDVKYAYGRLDHDLMKGSISVLAGQFLCPVAYPYPGPKTLRLPRWGDALNDYDIYSRGISLWYERDGFLFRGAHFNDNKLAVAISYQGISLFWEKNVGQGFIFDSPYTTWYCNIYAGYSNYKDSRNVFFFQNYVQLPANIRAYGHVDFGDTEKSWLFGLNYELAKNTFLKLFYETRNEKLLAEVAFSF